MSATREATRERFSERYWQKYADTNFCLIILARKPGNLAGMDPYQGNGSVSGPTEGQSMKSEYDRVGDFYYDFVKKTQEGAPSRSSPEIVSILDMVGRLEELAGCG